MAYKIYGWKFIDAAWQSYYTDDQITSWAIDQTNTHEQPCSFIGHSGFHANWTIRHAIREASVWSRDITTAHLIKVEALAEIYPDDYPFYYKKFVFGTSQFASWQMTPLLELDFLTTWRIAEKQAFEKFFPTERNKSSATASEYLRAGLWDKLHTNKDLEDCLIEALLEAYAQQYPEQYAHDKQLNILESS